MPDGHAEGDRLTLRGDEAHYLRRVLRMAPGDRFAAVLGGGSERVATVEAIGDECVRATLGPEIEHHADPEAVVRLYFGLAKVGKPELVIQKCTELGITSIHPMLCRRSVSRPPTDRAARKVERWQKIADEAARQCGRTSAAAVAPVVSFDGAVAEVAAGDGAGLMLTPDAGAQGLGTVAVTAPTSLLIGPEGGFAEDEVAGAREAGLTLVSVGERVLRAETAAIAAAAIVMHRLGEMG